MKQVEQLSIGGFAFKFEADAAESLRQYLTSLENHYMTREGGPEIMEGIEERIAELLQDSRTEVITISKVYEIISIIGKPETIEADDPEDSSGPAPSKKKKLFRDMDNKRLGGVCSGLATYIGLDVALMRLIWVGLAVLGLIGLMESGGISLVVPVIYCVLWIAMPPAKTAQERWAMKGDDGTLNGILRNAKAGVREMGETAREVGSSDGVRKLGRAIAILIGLVFLLVGAAGMAALLVVGFKGEALFSVPAMQLLDEFAIAAPGALAMLTENWVIVLVIAAVGLPLMSFLYTGCLLIFGFKEPSWRPGLVMFVIWLMVLVALAVVGFSGFLSAELITI